MQTPRISRMKKILAGVLLALSLPTHAQSLAELVEQKNFTGAAAVLKSGTDINKPTVDGTTALHWAAYYGELELVKSLLRAEAKPNTQNSYGSSPLMEAATTGNYEVMKLLLEAGADAQTANPEGQTALMAVARTGNIKAAELLIKRGAKVDAAEKWGGQTALMWAAARNQPDMVKLLIKNKAEVNKRAIDRNWERRTTSEPRVKEMLTGGFTPLLYAVRENCMECVKSLVEAGADVNKPDPDNVSPLILAILNMHFDVAKYLIERGADVNQWDYWGRTPLYAAADLNILPASARGDLPSLAKTSGIEIAKMLLDRGAEPNYALKLAPPPRNIVNDRAGDNPVMTTGGTPLQRAAYGGDVEMMRLLLERGADLTLGNIGGVTPMIALTNKGGTRNRTKDESSVLKGMELLLKAGANINQKSTATGETPLHTAVRMNWQSVVKFIVEKGGDLGAKENRGLTPFDYAIGKADSQAFGNFNVVGELPEMATLLKGLMDAKAKAQ